MELPPENGECFSIVPQLGETNDSEWQGMLRYIISPKQTEIKVPFCTVINNKKYLLTEYTC